MTATIGKLFGFLILLACVQTLVAQDACTPQGWASTNGGTTGGGSQTPVTVSTLADLQSQASSSGAKVIYVSGTVGAGVGTRVSVSSNKTIFGLPGARLNGGFDVNGVSNVIIRNMIIRGPGAIDVDGVDCMTIQNSTNIWVDHCDITDGQDGNLDVVNGSNYVTISWTKFSYSNASVEHQFCNLIGNSDSKTSDRGKLKVTMMFNYWTAGCVERMPRVRFGQVHVVNNLFDSQDGSYCVRAGIEADIYVEANAFIGVNKPIDLYQNDFTAVTATNNLFSGTSGNTLGSGTAFNPYASYSLPTKITAATVEAKVKPCVGATLSVPSVCPCNGALPIDLTAFWIEELSENILLNWRFSSTSRYVSAQVEFSGGGEFVPVADIPFPENSVEFPKSKFSESQLTFRIRFTDLDGSYVYSEVKSISQNISFTISPNPCFDHVYIHSPSNQGRIHILNLQGVLVVEKEFTQSELILSTSEFQPGAYWLHFIDSAQNSTKLLIKQ